MSEYKRTERIEVSVWLGIDDFVGELLRAKERLISKGCSPQSIKFESNAESDVSCVDNSVYGERPETTEEEADRKQGEAVRARKQLERDKKEFIRLKGLLEMLSEKE